MRIKGESYEAIAAAGGGILNSARKLQAMDEGLLYEQAAERLRVMILHGTTAVEIKSGYGLTVDAELKMLRVIKRLKSTFDILIKATFLGAHGIPMEYKSNPDSYVDLVVDEMLPKVMVEGLADHIDVFCDRGFFTVEQTDRILKAALAVGLPSKIHANELGLTGGVQVAVANGSLSADHLEHCSEVEVALLRESMEMGYGGTVPVGLPGTSYFLGIPYAPGRALIDAGLPFAMATDFNPGSSPIASLQIVWALGCTQMKLLPAEAFCAISRNAARALRSENEVGTLAAGQRANFFTTKTPDAIQAIPYFMGQNHCHQVFVNGSLFE
jgi:imidazolonepropionase